MTNEERGAEHGPEAPEAVKKEGAGGSAIDEGRLAQLQALQEEVMRRGIEYGPFEDIYDWSHLDRLSDLSMGMGFPRFLGAGSTRFVVGLGDGWVGKVAYRPFGLLQNLNAAAMWVGLPDEQRQWLAPCSVYSRSGFLVQRKAELFQPTIFSSQGMFGMMQEGGWWDGHYENACRDVRRRLAPVYRDFGDPHGLSNSREVRLDNYGDLDGRLVVLDYGHSPLARHAQGWVLSRAEIGVVDISEARVFSGEPTAVTLNDLADWAGCDTTRVCGCESGVNIVCCCGGLPVGEIEEAGAVNMVAA